MNEDGQVKAIKELTAVSAITHDLMDVAITALEGISKIDDSAKQKKLALDALKYLGSRSKEIKDHVDKATDYNGTRPGAKLPGNPAEDPRKQQG